MTFPLRIFTIIDDDFPTHRPDVSVLFGKYLPRYEVFSDLVARAGLDAAEDTSAWEAGRLFLAPRFPKNRGRSRLASWRNELSALWSLRSGDCDAIQVRDKTLATIPALLRAWQLKLPFFYWMSFPMCEAAQRMVLDHGRHLGWRRLVFKWLHGYAGAWLLYRVVLPRARHVFVQSERMRDDVAAFGIPRDKITPVPIGIDPARFVFEKIGPAVDHRLDGRRVIVYMGTCERSRRVDFLFEVLRRVRREEPTAMLLIVGDAPEEDDRKWLQRRAKDVDVSAHVWSTGWLPSSEAHAWVRRADVAVSIFPPDPLLDSCSPTKLVEYLALAKPVVANDHPDQAQVISESGAGLCVPFEVEAFAVAVLRLLRDTVAAQAMAARGPGYITRVRGYPALGRMVAEKYWHLLRNGTPPCVVPDLPMSPGTESSSRSAQVA